MSEREGQIFRLVLASVMSTTGLALLMMGFWVAPQGQIDQSVLIAFGEVMTFVGALLGIDYVARERYGGNRGEGGKGGVA